MCYHKQQRETLDDIANYYSASYEEVLKEIYGPRFYENGFDFLPGPIITAEQPNKIQLFDWGLIPWWIKSIDEAIQIRTKTLNCVSEEMYTKPSYRDAIKEGKRCLIPCTGFFEWRHLNNGKQKYPYFIHLTSGGLFSIAGIYSSWKSKSGEGEKHTYSVLTTVANPLMEKIHNSKKRMPVIIPRQYERDWLNPDLSQDDVLGFCQPLENNLLDAYTISKQITDRKITNKNLPTISEKIEYAELVLIDG